MYLGILANLVKFVKAKFDDFDDFSPFSLLHAFLNISHLTENKASETY